MKNPICIDAFCGAGGLSLGLKQAGFRVVAAFDKDPVSIQTYRRNVGEHAFAASAEEVGNDTFEQAIGDQGLDLLAGGPPCQGFSKQKRGAHNGDDRNRLVIEFARLVHELRPRFFLLENVAMFGQKRGRRFIETIESFLDSYVLRPCFYNSADFGLAQTRQRFIIVGVSRTTALEFHPPTPTTATWVTVDDVLKGLPEPPSDFSDHPDFPNHQRARVTPANIERFSFVPQGGGWQNIPEELRLPCHRSVDTTRGGWPDVYGRLVAKGQAPTITGGFDSFTRGRYGHPWSDRPLTPREAARIQGFPDSFIFMGTRQDIRRQIGNAVPPPLARAVATAILNCGQGNALNRFEHLDEEREEMQFQFL